MRLVTEEIICRFRGITVLIAAVLCVFAVAFRRADSVSREDDIPAVAAENASDALDDDEQDDSNGGMPTRRDVAALILVPDNIIEEFDVSPNGDHLLVPVTIGGQKVQFVVDTGCTGCVVDAALRSHLVETAESAVVNEQGQLEKVYLLLEASVGESHLPVISETVCVDLERLRDRFGCDFHGILGMSFLKSHVIHIDFDTGKLFILKDGPEPGEGAIGLGYSNDCPVLDVELFPGAEVPFIVDTGMKGRCAAGVDTTTHDILARQGRLTSLRRSNTVTMLFENRNRCEARLDRLKVDRFEHADVRIGSGDEVNRLTLAYLMRYAVTFDFPRGLVYLTPSKRFADPTPKNLTGMWLAWAGNDLIVEKVYDDSPSAAAGIRVADRLVLIDGKSPTELHESGKLPHEEGRRVRLVVQGIDEPREVEIVLSDWEVQSEGEWP